MTVEQKRNEEGAATEGRRTVKCADARQLILTADPAALRDRADVAFRAHLEACARCAADASRVVDDVARLRSALIARGSRAVAPRRSRNRVAVTLIPLALAAELALFAFLSNRDTVNPLIDRKISDDTVTTMLPATHTEIDTGDVSISAAVRRTPRVIATVDTSKDADSLAIDGPAKEPAPPPRLQVTPSSPRQQVAVIATSNPKITLVWITKGDSL